MKTTRPTLPVSAIASAGNLFTTGCMDLHLSQYDHTICLRKYDPNGNLMSKEIYR